MNNQSPLNGRTITVILLVAGFLIYLAINQGWFKNINLEERFSSIESWVEGGFQETENYKNFDNFESPRTDQAIQIPDNLEPEKIAEIAVDGSKKENPILIAKELDQYQECLGSFSTRMKHMEERYSSAIPNPQGPSGNERSLSNLISSIPNPKFCLEDLKKAEKSNALQEFDTASTQLASALNNLQPLLKEAQQYYERENYRDDGGEKGRQMHPGIAEALAQFNSAQGTLIVLVEEKRNENDPLLLAHLKENGPELAYLQEKANVGARTLLSFADPSGNLSGVDLEAFKTAIEEQEQTLAALENHMTLNPSKDPFAASDYRTYKAGHENLLISSKDLMRRIRDNDAYTSTEADRLGTSAGWMTDGSYDEMIRVYNSMKDW